MSVTSEAGFSQLPSDQGDAVSVSDVVVADVVEASDTADPSQHLRLHDCETAFGGLRDGQHSAP